MQFTIVTEPAQPDGTPLRENQIRIMGQSFEGTRLPDIFYVSPELSREGSILRDWILSRYRKETLDMLPNKELATICLDGTDSQSSANNPAALARIRKPSWKPIHGESGMQFIDRVRWAIGDILDRPHIKHVGLFLPELTVRLVKAQINGLDTGDVEIERFPAWSISTIHRINRELRYIWEEAIERITYDQSASIWASIAHFQ
jgi:hypothetical protein